MHVRGAPERDDVALGDRTARVKGEAVKDDDIVPAGCVGVERGLTDGKEEGYFGRRRDGPAYFALGRS